MLICWYKHVEPVNESMNHAQQQIQFHILQWINKLLNYFMILNVEFDAIAGFFFSISNDGRVFCWSRWLLNVDADVNKNNKKTTTTTHEIPTDRTAHVIIYLCQV